MAFVTVDLAEGVLLTGETVVDGTTNTEANLNDGNTGTSALNEIRKGMSGYRITHDLGFPPANLDTLSVRVFDGVMMTTGTCKIYPYQSDDASVNTGNPGSLTINDNAAYDTLALSAGFIGDLEDVGTNQISIRLVADDGGSLRGRFNEIEIEFTEASAGLAIPAAMAGYRRRHEMGM